MYFLMMVSQSCLVIGLEFNAVDKLVAVLLGLAALQLPVSDVPLLGSMDELVHEQSLVGRRWDYHLSLAQGIIFWFEGHTTFRLVLSRGRSARSTHIPRGGRP